MVDNLEWCNHRYNCNYGTRNIRRRVKMINNGCFLDLNSDEKKRYRKEYRREYMKKYRQKHKEIRGNIIGNIESNIKEDE